jgi:multisubunit Na+/H+ antiporter MnhB subunit
MGMEYLILLLLAFMLLAVLIAVEARDLLSSVISLGAGGFALSVVFLLLGAPDLAITQVVVEVIALVLLIRLVVTRRDTTSETPRDALRTGLVLLAGGVLLAGMFFAVGGAPSAGTIPPFGQPAMTQGPDGPDHPVARDYLARSAEETGAANAVMAVLLDYRAYDTLGEATVIFVSILGAYAVLRRVGRRRQEEVAS